MKRIFLFLAFYTLGIFGITAQESVEIVSVKVLSSSDKFRAGEIYPIALELKIDSLYHINSDQPPQADLIATTVHFEAGEGLKFDSPAFPEADFKMLSFSQTPLPVYADSIIIFSSVHLSRGFKGKEIEITGHVGYQACDDLTCLAPAEAPFKLRIPIAGREEAVSELNQDIFSGQPASYPEDEASDIEEGAFVETLGERGLFITFIFVFLGGIALNLTPCIYPLIPITISYFGGQAQGKKGSLVSHAGFYVIGMAITYSVLGLLASLTGSLFGSALQNPIVIVGIAVIMVALAMSMFNVYEFRLPFFLTNLAGGKKKGYLGTLLMGMTVGFVAAPCIGPFVLGLLTYVSERGNVILGFWLFFVLALGLGLPFLFLAIFSGNIERLPRSGAWMVWVRSIFGFVLIAMAIYFLQPLFTNTLFYHLTLALTLFCGGIYMAWIEPTQIPGKVFPLIRNLIGILMLTAALIFATTGIQDYIDEKLVYIAQSAGTAENRQDVSWLPYSPERLEEAVAQSKPALLDFYADWCIPCKELDKFTFIDPAVVSLSKKFMMLKVDLTKSNNPMHKTLERKYQIKGVPTLVLLKSNGTEAKKLRVVGFIKKEKLLERMEQLAAEKIP